jgi:hypothetical protein
VNICNRFVQKNRSVKPDDRVTVMMKGPGAKIDMPFDGAAFGGPAKSENRGYWISPEGAVGVRVPDVRPIWGKEQKRGEQGWEDVVPGSTLDRLLLPQPLGKDYRQLKIVTQPATADQIARLGIDRTPIVRSADVI